MANELQSLSVLFQNRLFRIPDYQRGYAWKDEQLVDFWDDLINLHENRYHYTGLLSLKEVKSNDVKTWQGDEWVFDVGFKPFHVVDGQQRLTTFSILLYEIVSFLKGLPENQNKADNNIFLGFESLEQIREKYIVRIRRPENLVRTYLFGYEVDNPSANYLRYKIFNEPFGGTVDESYYTKNLQHAKMFFIRTLSGLFKKDGIDGIKCLYRKLTLHLMFNLHEIEDDYDVFVAFETMNNRGKKLTNLELLKNRLIYLTTLFDDRRFDTIDKKQLRKNINDTWKEVYRQLGRNKEYPLSDDEFLKAHWISYFKYSRKGGNDYIRFLLGKFSAKNVFETLTEIQSEETEEILPEDEQIDDDEGADGETEEENEIETASAGKLSPVMISNYVNSLKALAEYWYYSYFPFDSEFSESEKIWLDKLNRIGIGYFRPLVAAALSTRDLTMPEERITLFQSIERFVFVCFRIGGFQANYQSSVYYNKSRDVLTGDESIASITEELNGTVTSVMDSAISSFIARTNRRFDAGEGFYRWQALKYFLYEYELYKLDTNIVQKIFWDPFIKAEKDKVSVEHILPQTPEKWYWRNAYRMFNKDEIKQLSASLGNLLPLSLSINSSLQNDSFPEKRKPPSEGHRGYINGSHSEIEVAQEDDWTADNILKRGLMLLAFMESRWDMTLTNKQKSDLLHIDFVNNNRKDVPELPETNNEPSNNEKGSADRKILPRQYRRQNFWVNFVDYCRSKGRGNDFALQRDGYSDWYNIPVGSGEYIFFFQIFRKKQIRIGLYVYRPDAFIRLESRKADIEKLYGSKLDWDFSPKSSIARRIQHSIDTDVHNPDLYDRNFDWLISQFDKLHKAIKTVDA